MGALGPSVARRWAPPGPRSRARPAPLGSVAVAAMRFSAGLGRSPQIRRQLAGPAPIRPATSLGPVRPPLWWLPTEHRSDPVWGGRRDTRPGARSVAAPGRRSRSLAGRSSAGVRRGGHDGKAGVGAARPGRAVLRSDERCCQQTGSAAVWVRRSAQRRRFGRPRGEWFGHRATGDRVRAERPAREGRSVRRGHGRGTADPSFSPPAPSPDQCGAARTRSLARCTPGGDRFPDRGGQRRRTCSRSQDRRPSFARGGPDRRQRPGLDLEPVAPRRRHRPG